MAKGFLFDVKVLELGDEKSEFCGKLLAGAGADLIKVEPPGGGSTRSFGPFYRDEPHPDRSLYFWHYNHGKRGVTLNIHAPEGQDILRKLISRTTILLDSLPPNTLESIGLDWNTLQKLNDRLIHVVMTHFGRSGPWRDLKVTDFVHLALGGQIMNCGYDPKEDLTYDTAPVAPQMWHAYHIAGNQAFIAIVGALIGRESTGMAELIDVPVHQACAVCTEGDVPNWIYQRKHVYRQTGRHAHPEIRARTQFRANDGRYNISHAAQPVHLNAVLSLFEEKGFKHDLFSGEFKDPEKRTGEAFHRRFAEVTEKFVAAYGFEEIWHSAQERGIPWAPIRLPEENLDDPQWQARATFTKVHHPELNKTFDYIGAPMLPEECSWRTEPRAPLVGEHNEEVYCGQLGLSREETEQLRVRKVI